MKNNPVKYPNLKEMLREELGNNRDHYLDITKLIRYNRNEMLKKEDPVFWNDIEGGYEDALLHTVMEDIMDRFPELQIDDVWAALESLDLVLFIEPEN